LKRLLASVGLAVFIGCCWTIFWCELRRSGDIEDTQAVVASLSQLDGEDPALELQWDLARWYNLNLTSVRKDRDFRDAYWDILDFTDHAMGILSVPAMGIRIPIYHGTGDLHKGAGHIQTTAFPLGQPGEHCALAVPVSLEEGTYFYIHLLQQVLAYQVTGTEYADPTAETYDAPEGETLCTLVCGEGDGAKLMRGSYDPAAPSEQSIRVETTQENDGWLAASCVVLAMGILLVPFLGLRGRDS